MKNDCITVFEVSFNDTGWSTGKGNWPTLAMPSVG